MAKRTLAMILVVITIFSCMVLPASAATCSFGTSTRVIHVTTKANWFYPGSESITLSQSKGTYFYNDWHGRLCSKNAYGSWNIEVRSEDGSHCYAKSWESGSIKLNLKPNKSYTITVSYNSTYDSKLKNSHFGFRWEKLPGWRVSGTWKIAYYW